jgi:Lon protease-like protein
MDPEPVALPLPMFPLGTVLFPFAPLPLHVFETRYRALVEDCLKGNSEFGVVLIERGSEVGGGDERFSVGTVARIVEAGRFSDGRWAVITVGTRRIKVRTWLPDDPYPVALVEELVDPPFPRAAAGLLADAERGVRRALALQSELEQPNAPSTVEIDDDPERATYQLAAVAPIGPVDRQRLLEESAWDRRLELLNTLSRDAAETFALRLSSG